MIKHCSKCGEPKPVTEFHKCSRNKDGVFSQCKSCRLSYQRTDRGKMLLSQANIRSRTNDPTFTISESDWSTHLNATECMLCGKLLPLGTHSDKQFDHKHGTNHYRGTLCAKCNVQLGVYEQMLSNPNLSTYMKEDGLL